MRPAVIILATLLLLTGCGPSSNPAPSPPSVLVTVAKAIRGSLPDVLTAYGSAAPSLNGSQTLSVPQAGQVTRLAITPNATVHIGQTLVVFTVDPASLSAYRQAVSALAAAQKQRDTIGQLLTQQLATRDQLTQADKAVSDAAAALDAMRQSGGGEAVRILKAPFDGIVSTVAVAQGDRTQPGAALVTVTKGSEIVATVGIDPATRSTVRAGQSVVLERLTGGPAVEGRVVRVDSALNPKTRQINVDITVAVGALLPGEAVQAGIRTGDISGWVVPHRAVVTADGGVHVYQISAGKAVAIPVTVSLAGLEKDVVRGSLDQSRPLIVDGAYQVQDGGAVRVAGR
jgi:RND family efflux transporter MFP subunit